MHVILEDKCEYDAERHQMSLAYRVDGTRKLQSAANGRSPKSCLSKCTLDFLPPLRWIRSARRWTRVHGEPCRRLNIYLVLSIYPGMVILEGSRLGGTRLPSGSWASWKNCVLLISLPNRGLQVGTRSRVDCCKSNG